MPYCDLIPGLIVAVHSGSRGTVFAADRVPDFALGRDAWIADITPPVLCIWTPNGGNCWNCSPCHLVSLEKDHFLKYLGKASDVSDMDNDGRKDLYRYVDALELLPWFCHAGAPGEMILCHVVNGVLMPDRVKNTALWKKDIAAADVAAEKATQQNDRATKCYDEELHSSLQKLLCYRLLGERRKGWSRFHKDLLSLSADGRGILLVGMTGKPQNVPIRDIEREIRKAFERDWIEHASQPE